MTTALLATKLHIPLIPAKRIKRPHLIQRLNQGLESNRQITLISAPAGFGKTLCASEWVNELDFAITWLSLDTADDDPGRFFSYFIAALQKVAENVGQEIEGILRAGQLPPGEIISTTLINDILNLEDRVVLVLDDFHVIQDEFILEVLEILLTNLPFSLHLVLVTREDPPLPLARLRVNNQLTEIRAGDLRFSRSEAEYFLNDVMELSLSKGDIDALEERTEGWIAGLHLAGLSIRDRSDASKFITTLSGSHRFILNYLTEEVLDQQPEHVKLFLLQTSILERLNGDLCNAITGRTDSNFLLESLYNSNLFLVPLDDIGDWYRYHQLFADLLYDLQNKYSKENTINLHQRASRWFAEAGMMSEAIEHALQAGNYTAAVQMIESHAMDLLMQWHIKTVEGWMQSIPPEWCSQSPQANLAFAWMHLMRGNHAQAAPYLERLQVMFSDPSLGKDDPSLEARWLALQAMLVNAQRNPGESLRLTQQALEIAPESDRQVYCMLFLEQANAYQQLAQFDQAIEAYQRIIQHGQVAGNSVFEMLGISGLVLLAIQHGHYQFAFEVASQGIERIERSGSLPPISTAVYGELGVIYYQWYQLERAHHNFQRAIQVSTLSGYSDAEVYYGVILSRLFQITGDLEAADREIKKALDLMQINAPTTVREEAVAQQVRINLFQDRLVAAERLLERENFSFHEGFSYPDLATTLGAKPSRGVLYTSALRILLYRVQALHDPSDLILGIELADKLIEGALQSQFIPFAVEVLLVRAQLHAAQDDKRASHADLLHALQLAEPESFISIFVEEGLNIAGALESMLLQDKLSSVQPEYVERILAAFYQSQVNEKEQAVDLAEPLTERELDVLRSIAEGLKYEEIADKLYISLNTVRSHVKSIYSKLNVDNRTKAIEAAHEMGIL